MRPSLAVVQRSRSGHPWQRTPKTAARFGGDRDGVAGRASGGPGCFVDDEVVLVNPPGMAVVMGQGLMARRCLALPRALSVSPEP